MNTEQERPCRDQETTRFSKVVQKTRYPGDWHLNMTDELYSVTGCHLIPYSIQWQISAAAKSGLQHVHDYI